MDPVPPPRLGHPRGPLVGADLLEEVGTPAAPESEAAHEPLSVMRRGVRGRLEGSLPQLCGAEPSRYLCLYGWSFCCAVLLLRRWMTKRPAPKWQKSQIVPCCFLAYCDTDMAGTNQDNHFHSHSAWPAICVSLAPLHDSCSSSSRPGSRTWMCTASCWTAPTPRRLRNKGLAVGEDPNSVPPPQETVVPGGITPGEFLESLVLSDLSSQSLLGGWEKIISTR